jgi:hypothetical protein
MTAYAAVPVCLIRPILGWLLSTSETQPTPEYISAADFVAMSDTVFEHAFLSRKNVISIKHPERECYAHIKIPRDPEIPTYPEMHHDKNRCACPAKEQPDNSTTRLLWLQSIQDFTRVRVDKGKGDAAVVCLIAHMKDPENKLREASIVLAARYIVACKRAMGMDLPAEADMPEFVVRVTAQIITINVFPTLWCQFLIRGLLREGVDHKTI